MFVGFNRRFDPNFHALKQRLDAGAIGAVEQVHHHQPRSRAAADLRYVASPAASSST